MNIGNLIFTLPAWQKTLVRKAEKENKKIANTESSLVYNIYIYIYIHMGNVFYLCFADLPLYVYNPILTREMGNN